MAEGSQRVFGLHAAETVIARRPADILAAHLLSHADSGRLDPLARRLRACGIDVKEASRRELDRLCGNGRHQGIVLEVRRREGLSLTELETLVTERGRSLRLLILDQVEDPRNLGACLRTAAAAGADAVVVPRSRSAKLTSGAVKAAAGAAEAVPVVSVPNLARMLAWLRDAGVWIVGLDSAAEQSLYEAALEPPIGLVLGGEAQGLRRLTREHCDAIVTIPMAGPVESLNVSVAAGIVLFELLRQSPVEG